MLNTSLPPEEKVQNDKMMRTRLSGALKARVELAASALGMEASVFVRRVIAREADQVLASQTRYEMTPEDIAAFSAALDTPPKPTTAAIRAAKRYQNRVVHAD